MSINTRCGDIAKNIPCAVAGSFEPAAVEPFYGPQEPPREIKDAMPRQLAPAD